MREDGRKAMNAPVFGHRPDRLTPGERTPTASAVGGNQANRYVSSTSLGEMCTEGRSFQPSRWELRDELLRRDVLAAVFLTEAVGVTSGALTAGDISAWYVTLQQLALTPPNCVFGPVWTLLYALMGVAAALAWRQRGRRDAQAGLVLFSVQLALNCSWSLVFFGGRDPLAGCSLSALSSQCWP